MQVYAQECRTQGGKKMPNPLELELLEVVSHPPSVGLGTKPGSIARAVHTLFSSEPSFSLSISLSELSRNREVKSKSCKVKLWLPQLRTCGGHDMCSTLFLRSSQTTLNHMGADMPQKSSKSLDLGDPGENYCSSNVSVAWSTRVS